MENKINVYYTEASKNCAKHDYACLLLLYYSYSFIIHVPNCSVILKWDIRDIGPKHDKPNVITFLITTVMQMKQRSYHVYKKTI